ncbi:MAG: MBL fold metallo-hydrolase [Nanoarchaeota archaeon]|nr:MBL fold metallo-hydrolase [Nanoarchaeota archaeon]
MQIKLFGAAKTVTGSCYSLVTGKDRILIDCGMFQGSKKEAALNYDKFGFNPWDYSALLLTHAHLDHCGRIPKLVKAGFKGRIFCTSATKDLAHIIMLDSAKINKYDVELENKRRQRLGQPPREPMYTEKDVENAMNLFKVIEYNKLIKVSENINATFYDAGHILGSSFIQVGVIEKGKTTTIVFSGDIGQENAPIIKNLEHIQKADYVFIESTYGDRIHPPIAERKQELLNIIHNTYNNNGKVLIPAFAVERTQELLYDINELVEKNLIPKINVYVDTPMGIRVTEVFKRHPECYDKKILELLKSGDNPFSFPGLKYTHTVKESIKLNKLHESCIIIAGSGMCTGGRIKHHIKHHIWNKRNTMLFVGYQAKGTLGYYIKRGEKRIRLLGTQVAVKAKIESIESFSAHADYKGLLNWLKHFSPKPKKIFIMHGEEQAMIPFSKRIEELGLKTRIPDIEEEITL